MCNLYIPKQIRVNLILTSCGLVDYILFPTLATGPVFGVNYTLIAIAYNIHLIVRGKGENRFFLFVFLSLNKDVCNRAIGYGKKRRING
jgi:hypothetical protein